MTTKEAINKPLFIYSEADNVVFKDRIKQISEVENGYSLQPQRHTDIFLTPAELNILFTNGILTARNPFNDVESYTYSLEEKLMLLYLRSQIGKLQEYINGYLKGIKNLKPSKENNNLQQLF
jgi:hypothetical protein